MKSIDAFAAGPTNDASLETPEPVLPPVTGSDICMFVVTLPRSTAASAIVPAQIPAGVTAPDLHDGVEITLTGTAVSKRTGTVGHFRRGDNDGSDEMPFARDPKANHVLAALPEEELQRLLPRLEWTDLPLGQVLYESSRPQSHVYFPTTAIVALLYVTDSGNSVELAVVGHEGVVGVSLFMGGGSTPSRAVVQGAGAGYRLSASAIKDEFSRSGPAMHVLLRYTQALITQMMQTAACNRHHVVDQRLCRSLLLSLDRLRGNEIVMTHELIATMLGIRREGVTEGATRLQKAGLIRYRRGHITVLDRKGLEERACECYAVVKREYERLLPDRMAT